MHYHASEPQPAHVGRPDARAQSHRHSSHVKPHRPQRLRGLGLTGADLGLENHTDAQTVQLSPKLDSIAIGQATYEGWSAPRPMEPLAQSPTESHHPWSLQQHVHDRKLYRYSSKTQLIPSIRGPFSSTTYPSSHNNYKGGRYQSDIWESFALQTSDSYPTAGYNINMENTQHTLTSFTPGEEKVVETKLVKCGYHDKQGKKTLKFWILILAFSVTIALTALDMTMISTALPSIVRYLPESTIAGGWVTSSYLLTVTAFQPLFGGLSCVIGRRGSSVLAILLFIVGSVICARADSILMLVVGRGVQGLGGGGIQAVGEITVSDITTLRERGFFVGIFGLVFAVSSFIAPVLGGYLSDHNWRWIFYINIPLGALALIMLVPTLNLPVSNLPLKTKLAKMDVFGNLVLLGSVVSILVAVTEGGVNHAWSSARIIVPFAVGMAGFVVFLLIEFLPNPLSTHPVLPLRLFKNRTASSAFFMTFLHGVATYGAIYALPLYFQAIRAEKPLKSAVSTFPSTAPTAPFAIIAGIIMAVTGKYKKLTFGGWAFTVAGFAWMTRFQVGTELWELVLAQIVAGVGIGILFAVTLPPIQASLPLSELETSTATFAFCRSFGSIWGIAITTSVLTATVSKDLPSVPEAAKLGLIGPTVLGYVENIHLLPDSIQGEIKKFYADGLQKGFYAFIPVVAVGFLCCFFLEDLPLPDFIREEGHEEITDKNDEEAATTPNTDAEKSRRQSQSDRAEDSFHEIGESSPDPTLAGSYEKSPISPTLTDSAFDVVQYQQQSNTTNNKGTPEGYALQSFSYSPSIAENWNEKHDAKPELAASARAFF